MHRAILTVYVVLLVLCCPPGLPAQAQPMEEFQLEFFKGFEIGEPKLMDKAMKRNAENALRVLEDLFWSTQKGEPEAVAQAKAKVDALMASWKRCFNNTETMEKLHRWCDGATGSVYEQLNKIRSSSGSLWQNYEKEVSKAMIRTEYQKVVLQFEELARSAESLGHNLEASKLWSLASVVATKSPDKTLDDRKEVLHILEQFLNARKSWDYAFDEHYLRNVEFLKFEKVRVEEDVKLGDKRKEAGYDPNAKGVDNLVMPNVPEEKHTMKYEALASWDSDLDYGPKGGPIPAFWWLVSTNSKEGNVRELDWFRRRKLYVFRLGSAKFGVALENDAKKAMEVEAGSKGKPTTFYLDADKKVPYTMFFWVGGEREMVGEVECNLAPSTDVGNIYYRSAASWRVSIGAESLVLYDDNANGTPCDVDPFEPPLRVPTLGDSEGEGTIVPMFDSMRIGKGPRVPYSEFLHLPTGWFHMRKSAAEEVGLRPLNLEFMKLGKIKLVWNGPKPTAPVQLVVKGEGDYKTAFFDLAGGKELDVPAGNYNVIFGRIMNGKGTRAQMATLYQGNSKPFTVEAGKVFELKMGAPFALQFVRRGDHNATIDATTIMVSESSGCVITELHGMSLAPEVLAAKTEDGKGAKVVAKFVKFTDPELLNKAAIQHNKLGNLAACFPMPEGYREKELILSVTMPAENWKISLSVKKHSLFGPMSSPWQ
ncbi:MAG TPA: hypothetical protein VFT55_11515 [Planctomycetota bacterium]|nr:hypothetical protein [Planctomycetota bacterium]